eukprot:TRINITY_DN365_c0_g1_i3.p1 TRINITY_DN365_c0_g1~~TRINITY_DN365_c0_g1_i3.p1  ORF type:complete len:945 (-),score=277.90 TRINITY_DN365_c0_g1_i3:100-2934(-)
MNKKILLPLGALSLGALTYIAYYLSSKKKYKLVRKDIKELEQAAMNDFEKSNINSMKKNLDILLKYDWKELDMKKKEDRNLYLFSLRNVILNMGLILGDKFDVVMELLDISLEKLNQILSQPLLTQEEKYVMLGLISTFDLILSSRKFNMHFKYNDHLPNQLKKILIILDNKKNKRNLIKDLADNKMALRCSIVDALMMREKYNEIVDKYLVLIDDPRFSKMLERPLTENFCLLTSFYNVVDKSTKVTEEYRQKVKKFCREYATKLSSVVLITGISVSIGRYDFFLDSLKDEINSEGISTKLIFAALKDGVPIDCKIKIKDLNEKVIYHEEVVKKKQLPKEFLGKDKVILRSVLDSLEVESDNQMLEYFYHDKKFSDSQAIINNNVEANFKYYAAKSSSFCVNKGFLVVCFEVDEGQGYKEVAKFFTIKSLSSKNEKLTQVLRDKDWLPKTGVNLIIFLQDHLIWHLDTFHSSKNIDKCRQFLEKRDMVKFNTLFINEHYFYECLFTLINITYGICMKMDKVETVNRINTAIETHLSLNSPKVDANEIVVYLPMFYFYEHFELTEELENVTGKVILYDISNLSISGQEINIYMMSILWEISNNILKDERDLSVKNLDHLAKIITNFSNIVFTDFEREIHQYWSFVFTVCDAEYALSYEGIQGKQYSSYYEDLPLNLPINDTLIYRRYLLYKFVFLNKLEKVMEIEPQYKKELQNILDKLERELEKYDASYTKTFHLDEVVNQLTITASMRHLQGKSEKVLGHLLKIKKMGEQVDANRFYLRDNCHFNFKNHFFERKSSSLASLSLKIDICFRFNNKKDTFVVPGDVLKFCLVPFSKIDLIANKTTEQLVLLSSTDNSITCFEKEVEKVHTVFVNNFLKRALVVEKEVALFGDEISFVLRGEAYNKEGLMIGANFLFFELEESTAVQEYSSFLDKFDFSLYLKSL